MNDLMLSPNRPTNVKLLVGFLVFFCSKLITLKHRGRGGGGFLGFNLPNHDAKGWKGKTVTKKETQGPIAFEKVRAQKSQ